MILTRKRWRVALYDRPVELGGGSAYLGRRDFVLWRNALRWARCHYDHDGIRVDAWKIGSR